MNIIFGDEQATQLAEKYTVLALDTFKFGQDGPHMTAYCVVENLSLAELPMVDSLQKLHSDLIANYKNKQWNYCGQVINRLRGSWSGELDTFYDELQKRIEQYKENDPGEHWSPVIEKPIGQSF